MKCPMKRHAINLLNTRRKLVFRSNLIRGKAFHYWHPMNIAQQHGGAKI
jgi:hypothetical protein